MEKGKITKDQFESYVRVQKSGVTNMFDIRNAHEIRIFMYIKNKNYV